MTSEFDRLSYCTPVTMVTTMSSQNWHCSQFSAQFSSVSDRNCKFGDLELFFSSFLAKIRRFCKISAFFQPILWTNHQKINHLFAYLCRWSIIISKYTNLLLYRYVIRWIHGWRSQSREKTKHVNSLRRLPQEWALPGCCDVNSQIRRHH